MLQLARGAAELQCFLHQSLWCRLHATGCGRPVARAWLLWGSRICFSLFYKPCTAFTNRRLKLPNFRRVGSCVIFWIVNWWAWASEHVFLWLARRWLTPRRWEGSNLGQHLGFQKAWMKRKNQHKWVYQLFNNSCSSFVRFCWSIRDWKHFCWVAGLLLFRTFSHSKAWSLGSTHPC